MHFAPRRPDPGLRKRLLGDHAGHRIVMTAGNLVPRKGHDMVIRALAECRSTLPNLSYLIVGDGPNRGALEQLAATLGVQDRVCFAGRVPDRDLPGVYALADVFVMPSRYREGEDDVEGFGIVLLEAAACGKPVIGGRAGGSPEAIRDGETGLVVDPLDPSAIAAGIGRILGDPELAARMGRAGRDWVEREFNWARAADRIHRLALQAKAPIS